MTDRCRGALRIALVSASAMLAACAGHGPGAVSPAEVPDLAARVAREPDNAKLRSRYAAALLTADRCDQAAPEARRAQQQQRADAVPVLVLGQCAEKAQRYDDALSIYRAFLADQPSNAGAATIRAREHAALRDYSNARARLALQNESQLSSLPADPNTIAVLPVTIASSDSSYRPLERGLAQIITSDLSLIQRFKLVERLRLGALLDEMQLGTSGRVDATTAARVGRLMQAGRMVQGLAAIPPQGDTRLEVSVVQPTGEVSAPAAVTGRFRDLLRMEKDLVVQLSARLGYQLSEAERRRVLENGTKSLTAFLAYSRGLLAEDGGDFSRAAAFFSDAVRADPGFQAARDQFQAATVSTDVQQGTPTTAVVAPPSPTAGPETGIGGQLQTGIGDLAGTISEKTAAPGATQPAQPTGTPSADPAPTPKISGTPASVSGTIRIVFRLP